MVRAYEQVRVSCGRERKRPPVEQLTRNSSAMNAYLPYNAGNGMDRFFSPTNLCRYRSLAAHKINAAERNQILKMLAKEWIAFSRGCRKDSGLCVGSSKGERRFSKKNSSDT